MVNFLDRFSLELLAHKSAYLENQNLLPARRNIVLEVIRCFTAMMLRRLRQHGADQLLNISFYDNLKTIKEERVKDLAQQLEKPKLTASLLDVACGSLTDLKYSYICNIDPTVSRTVVGND